MKTIVEKFTKLVRVVSNFLIIYSLILFLNYTKPIIKNYPMFLLIMLIPMLALFLNPLYSFFSNRIEVKLLERINKLRVPVIISTGVILSVAVYLFSIGTVTDFFQPFSIHDDQIFIFLGGLGLYIVKYLIDLVRYIIKRDHYDTSIISHLSLLFILLVIVGWNNLQTHYPYENGVIKEAHIYDRADNVYASYRIPSLLVIPKGSTLGNGDSVNDDMILTFAEARKHSSHDNGNIDMVMRRSLDSGNTWEDMVVVTDLGDNKMGNFTPVYDAKTGTIFMLHLRNFYDNSKPRGAYMMTSSDGGVTWSDGTLILEKGGIGPGHGIQLSGGEYDGRLLIPGYKKGAMVYYSDDHGQSWQVTEQLNMGNETEITQLDEDTVVMTTRVNINLAAKHDKIFKHFSFSYDGGVTWSDPEPVMDVITPICMSGLSSYSGTIYYSGPQEHFSRSNIKILQSSDNGESFQVLFDVYEGPAGYSDLETLSNGDIVILFENGAVEYDERLTFMKFAH